MATPRAFPRIPVTHLQRALEVWEGLNLSTDANAALSLVAREGRTIEWWKLRSHLLTLGRVMRTSNPYQEEPREFQISNFQIGSPLLDLLPMLLCWWNGTSRRVFALDADLQAYLNMVGIGNTRFEDIMLPFPAFMVTLGQPIFDENGRSYDGLMVVSRRASEPPYDQQLTIIAFPTELLAYEAIGQYRQDQIREAISRGNDRRLRDLLRETHLADRLPAQVPWRSFELLHSPANSILQRLMSSRRGLARSLRDMESQVRAMRENQERIGRQMRFTVPRWRDRRAFFDLLTRHAAMQEREQVVQQQAAALEERTQALMREAQAAEFVNIATRIALGLCFYLQLLPPGTSAQRSDWQPLRHSQDPRAIRIEAQVCSVTGVQFLPRLTPEMWQLFAATLDARHSILQRPADLVRGHWRRRMGEGHVVNAPRVVLIKPYLRGEDRLGPDGLAGGVITRV